MTIETARDILRRRANGDSYRQIAMHVNVKHVACFNLCRDPARYPVEEYRCDACGEIVGLALCPVCRRKKVFTEL